MIYRMTEVYPIILHETLSGKIGNRHSEGKACQIRYS